MRSGLQLMGSAAITATDVNYGDECCERPRR